MDQPKNSPAAYKKIKAATGDTTKAKPLFMVEKKDGSIGQWGNPLTPADTTKPSPKKVMELSEKARGLSTNYYPARDQQSKPAIPSIKKNNY